MRTKLLKTKVIWVAIKFDKIKEFINILQEMLQHMAHFSFSLIILHSSLMPTTKCLAVFIGT